MKDTPHVVIEAVRLNEDNVDAVATWSRADTVEEIDPEHTQETQKGLNVTTPTGVKRASLGMYVLKIGKNFYVSHNRSFEMTYKPMDRPSPPPESIGEARRALGFSDPFAQGRLF